MNGFNPFRAAYDRAEINLQALEHMSRFLNFFPKSIRGEDVRSVAEAAGLPEEKAYAALAAAICGLDGEVRPKDRVMEEYFSAGIRCMDGSGCEEDPYYQRIRLPQLSLGEWELGYQELAPYEAFPREDLLILPDGREIPRAGYFTHAFQAPVVRQRGREWMTVTPSERNTMLSHIAQAQGRVAVFGLGLGYYPYMISEKTGLRGITVIERDPAVIRLFREAILPQFPRPEFIQVVQADAFDFAAQMEGYDTAYVDLWHDTRDGAELYLRMKRLEKGQPRTRFLYWIEPSILALIRSLLIYDHQQGNAPDWLKSAGDSEELEEMLSNERLRERAAELPLSLVRME